MRLFEDGFPLRVSRSALSLIASEFVFEFSFACAELSTKALPPLIISPEFATFENVLPKHQHVQLFEIQNRSGKSRRIRLVPPASRPWTIECPLDLTKVCVRHTVSEYQHPAEANISIINSS